MPRVPGIPQVQSRAVNGPRYQNDARGTFGEGIAEGLQQLGRGADVASQRVAQAYERADNTFVQDALNEFDRNELDDWNGDLKNGRKGFGHTQGDEALTGAEGFYKSRERDIEELSKRFTNDSQRRKFKEEIDRRMLHVERKVENKFAVETERKRRSTLVIASDQSRQKALSAPDASAFQAAIFEGSAAVAELEDTSEAADAAMKKWQGETFAAAIEQKINQGALTEAKHLFGATRERIPPKSREAIETYLTKAERALEAEKFAESALEVAKGLSDGPVNAEYALSIVDTQVPAETPEQLALRDDVKRRLKERIIQSDRAWDEETKEISRKAFATYNVRGWRGMPEPLKEQLNDRNPALYARLKAESEQRWRQHQAGSAEARRAQAELNRLAMQEYMKLPVEDRAELEVPIFLAGLGADRLGVGAVEVQQRKDKTAVEKGGFVRENEFVTTALAQAQGVIGKDKQKREAFEAEARIAYDRFVTANGGKPPTRDDELKLSGELLSKTLRERLGGLIETEEYEFQKRARERKEAVNDQAPGQSAVTAPTTIEEAPKPVKKVVITNGARRLNVNEEGLDAWLATHPGWRRE